MRNRNNPFWICTSHPSNVWQALSDVGGWTDMSIGRETIFDWRKGLQLWRKQRKPHWWFLRKVNQQATGADHKMWLTSHIALPVSFYVGGWRLPQDSKKTWQNVGKEWNISSFPNNVQICMLAKIDKRTYSTKEVVSYGMRVLKKREGSPFSKLLHMNKLQ